MKEALPRGGRASPIGRIPRSPILSSKIQYMPYCGLFLRRSSGRVSVFPVLFCACPPEANLSDWSRCVGSVFLVRRNPRPDFPRVTSDGRTVAALYERRIYRLFEMVGGHRPPLQFR